MTFFQLKSYTFINHAIKRVIEHIKTNAKNQCPFAVLKNDTFWKRFKIGKEIHTFFHEMTQQQIIQFFSFFDIFFIGFNGINAFISMTADPLNQNFEKTLWMSISKGYNKFQEYCSPRSTTPLSDLRNSIGNSQSPIQHFGGISSESSFGSGFPSVDRACGPDATPLLQGLSTHFGGGGLANSQYSPFQQLGHLSFGAGPASNFSFFSSQPPALEGNVMNQSLFDRMPVCSIFSVKPVNPFTSNADFVPVQPMSEPLHRQGQLKIVKGRVVRVEIPSDCSSGPSTSSTVEGIAKESPRTQTPIATTIANLEKKIWKLESQNRQNPHQESLDFLQLKISRAKLEKIQNSS